MNLHFFGSLWTFGGIMSPCFVCLLFLCFFIEICASEAESLVEVLITCSLAVEVFSIVRQECVVAELQCGFSPLDWGIGQKLSFCLCAQSTKPDPQQNSDREELVGVSVVACVWLGVIYGLRVGLVKDQLSTSLLLSP
jgi:hypothetical protein